MKHPMPPRKARLSCCRRVLVAMRTSIIATHRAHAYSTPTEPASEIHDDTAGQSMGWWEGLVNRSPYWQRRRALEDVSKSTVIDAGSATRGDQV